MDPFSMAAVVHGATTVAGSLISNTFQTVTGNSAKELLAAVKARSRGKLALPANHDLVRGIRAAHLAAVERVLKNYQRQTSDLRPLARDSNPAFQLVLKDWLGARLQPLNMNLTTFRRAKVDHEVVTADDVERALNEVVHPSHIEGFDGEPSATQKLCEESALQELAKACGDLPPRFVRCFKGQDGGTGWYEVFGLLIGEEIKTNERFRSIFLATEQIETRRAVERQSAALLELTERSHGAFSAIYEVERITSKIDETVRIEGDKIDQILSIVKKENAIRVTNHRDHRGISTGPQFRIVVGRDADTAMIARAVELDSMCFSAETCASLETCIEWWTHNPDTYIFLVNCLDGTVVGYLNTMAVADDLAAEIERGTIIDPAITCDAIYPMELPGLYNLFICSIVIHPGFRGTAALRTLTEAFWAKLRDLAKNEIFIKRFYADAFTLQGRQMCQHLGMERLCLSDHASTVFGLQMMPPTFVPATDLQRRLHAAYTKRHAKLIQAARCL